jgi:hypothetical protein
MGPTLNSEEEKQASRNSTFYCPWRFSEPPLPAAKKTLNVQRPTLNVEMEKVVAVLVPSTESNGQALAAASASNTQSPV